MNNSTGAFKLGNGTIIPFVHTEQTQFESIALNNFRINDDLLIKHEIEAYFLNDNNVICHSNDSYMKFKSLEDLMKVINDFEINRYNRIEPLSGLNKFNEKFPLNTNKIIFDKIIELNIKIPSESNDFNYILKKTDEYLRKKENDNDYIIWNNFIYFIALVGEASKEKNITLKWRMKLGIDNRTWNPEIHNGNKVCDIVYIVQKYTFENPSKSKLDDCLHMVLNTFV